MFGLNVNPHTDFIKHETLLSKRFLKASTSIPSTSPFLWATPSIFLTLCVNITTGLQDFTLRKTTTLTVRVRPTDLESRPPTTPVSRGGWRLSKSMVRPRKSVITLDTLHTGRWQRSQTNFSFAFATVPRGQPSEDDYGYVSMACLCLHDLWCFIFVTIKSYRPGYNGNSRAVFSWIISACDAINVSLSIIIPVLKVSSLFLFHFLFTRKHLISSFMQKLFLKLDTCRRLTNMLWTLRYFRCLIRLVFPVTVLQGFTFVFLHGVVTDRILLWRKQISYQSQYLIVLKDDFKL